MRKRRLLVAVSALRQFGVQFPDPGLNSLELDLTYAYDQTWVGSVSLFNTNGSRDVRVYHAAGARLPAATTARPNSRGYVLGLEYVPFGKLNSFASPWLNLRIGLQYTGYQRFNGAGSNYDGFGRSASDNNTLFFLLASHMRIAIGKYLSIAALLFLVRVAAAGVMSADHRRRR